MSIKFRKKPVVIEAMQWDGARLHVKDEYCALEDWIPESDFTLFNNNLYIHTLEGDMRVSVRDWVIKGVNGGFYPCKPNIFEKTYEEVTK